LFTGPRSSQKAQNKMRRALLRAAQPGEHPLLDVGVERVGLVGEFAVFQRRGQKVFFE